MFIAYVVVTVVTAAGNLSAAVADFARKKWILENMTAYGIPHSWIIPLGWAKGLGAAGLLVGFAVPPIGLAAAIGLLLYFAGAIATVARARYHSHLIYPSIFLLLAAATLVLHLAAAR
ncbi:DoxX family protein [Spongiactinospora sp. TRM90649]|uniref:DoxX family protein n=1 Tax=Spongiactinospora sp. TRM90649 TaxID=3031114 RepID=UPI0023F7E1E1|nr:DoxX family protein [Spongiactinospora sp. TRM90649]MDF5756020.1 DoxX family protein [Spongiactinospora sp. TRM90649]